MAARDDRGRSTDRRTARTEVWERAASAQAESAIAMEASRSAERVAAWYDLGYSLHADGDLGGAEDAYRRALGLDDGMAHAWFNLGNVLAEAGRHAEAVEVYRESVALDSTDHEAWNNLGVGLCDCGDLREALACFEAAIALEPGYHPAWNNLGNAVEAFDGDLPRAVNAYRRAISLRHDRANYHLNLASALCRLERSDEARRHLGDALKMDPGLRTVVPAFPEFEELLNTR